MVKKITLSVPDGLHEKMENWRKSLNFSKIFQGAITNEIEKKERFQFKLKGGKSMQEIMEHGNFETNEGQFQTGKDFGFAYAKSLKYHELKPYEEYIEGWNKQDPEIIDRVFYDLDIISIFHNMGLVTDQTEEIEKFDFENADYLGSSFDIGLVTGLMEFLQGECSAVEVGKIVLERDKELRLAKDENQRLKIWETYKNKINNKIDA